MPVVDPHIHIRAAISAFKNKDVAFLHKDSRSLIEADLLFNLPPNEQVSRLAYLACMIDIVLAISSVLISTGSIRRASPLRGCRSS